MDFNELVHILISVVTISLAFSIVFSGQTLESNEWTMFFFPVLLSVGLGFILHELAHKYLAIKYGCFAQYRMWTMGLIIALILAIGVGFVFAAPGAVYIHGPHLTKKQNAMIALAGPAMNAVLAIIFAAAFSYGVIDQQFAQLGVNVNLWLALFNLVPFGPFDGQKVYEWNKGVWISAVAIVALAFFGFSVA